MSVDILKKVTELALSMIEKAEANDVEGFDKQYKELETICTQNAGGAKDHPVQWETLADFTQDLEQAIEIYKKALTVAEKLKEHQYSASIHYAMADMYSDLDNKKAALDHANKAKTLAAKLDDEELKSEIDTLLAFINDEE